MRNHDDDASSISQCVSHHRKNCQKTDDDDDTFIPIVEIVTAPDESLPLDSESVECKKVTEHVRNSKDDKNYLRFSSAMKVID